MIHLHIISKKGRFASLKNVQTTVFQSERLSGIKVFAASYLVLCLLLGFGQTSKAQMMPEYEMGTGTKASKNRNIIDGESLSTRSDEKLTIVEPFCLGNIDKRASKTIEASNVISGTANVYYRAGKNIKFTPGFKVTDGARFKAKLIEDSESINPMKKSSLERNSNVDDFDYTIYPNPVDDIMIVCMENNQDKKINVLLYNNLGRRVHQEFCTGNTFKVDLSHLSPGSYILKIYREESAMLTKKVIKN